MRSFARPSMRAKTVQSRTSQNDSPATGSAHLLQRKTLRLNAPDDRFEREADQAAESVMAGKRVSLWPASDASPTVQCDGPPDSEVKEQKSDMEKLKDGLLQTGQAFLETPAGKALIERLKQTPVYSEALRIIDSVTSRLGRAFSFGGGLAAYELGMTLSPAGMPEGAYGVGLTLTEAPPRVPDRRDTARSPASTTRPATSAPVPITGIPAGLNIEDLIRRYPWLAPPAPPSGPQLTMTERSFGYRQKPLELIPELRLQQPERKKTEESNSVQRKTMPGTCSDVQVAPPSVDAALATPGQAIEAGTRWTMEARFGHDFSRVRVHTDAVAAQSARDLNASAYTVGKDIVFGQGRFSPGTLEGQRLLAHELTHVVQQGAGRAPDRCTTPASRPDVVQRRGFFESFGIWLGVSEGEFSDDELASYLKAVDSTGNIEDSNDSDNKARAIVRRWKAGNRNFDLTPHQKIMLIREMQSGPTGDDDEQAILDLLENTGNGDLRLVFAKGAIDVAQLNDDFHGSEWKRLQAFYGQRFKGGLQALLGGTLEPQDKPAAGAPVFPYNWAILLSRLTGPHDFAAEIVTYLDRLTPDERRQARSDLRVERTTQHKALRRLRAEKKPKSAQDALSRELDRIEAALTHLNQMSFAEKDLTDYLAAVDASGVIEAKDESGSKAVEIESRWKNADTGFDLTPGQKIMLIKEMQFGYTDASEQAILDLLENSVDGDLAVILSPGGVKAIDLDESFRGKEWDQLHDFFSRRFKGGLPALQSGKVQAQGGAAAGAPVFPYNWAILQGRLAGPHDFSGEVIGYLDVLKPDEKERAISDLQAERIKQRAQEKQLVAAKHAQTVLDPVQKLLRRIEAALAHMYKNIALAEDKTALAGKIKPVTSSMKVDISKALRPEVKVNALGQKLPFNDAPGYEQKLRKHLDDRIQECYDAMVVGKGKKEHDDPNLSYPLVEFEKIGRVAKDETDAVFGKYKMSADLKADTRTRTGKIHDLWARLDRDIRAMNPPDRRDMAKTLILYFLGNDKAVLYTINDAHNAEPEFRRGKPKNDEAKIQVDLSLEYTDTTAKVKKLNEIDRGWPATQSGSGDINVQVFKPVDPVTKQVDELQERLFRWSCLQTLIHEYCHTLIHAKYRDYANTFGYGTPTYSTLMEGVDSMLDEVVWANVQPRVSVDSLRQKVEGTTYAAHPFDARTIPPILDERYPSYDQAIKLANIVGIRNVYEAYFMGKVNLIGA